MSETLALVRYTDADRWLTEALETDPLVMADLGGPWSPDAIDGIHQRRLTAVAAGGWWETAAWTDQNTAAASKATHPGPASTSTHAPSMNAAISPSCPAQAPVAPSATM